MPLLWYAYPITHYHFYFNVTSLVPPTLLLVINSLNRYCVVWRRQFLNTLLLHTIYLTNFFEICHSLWFYYYDITMVLLLWHYYGVTTMTSLWCYYYDITNPSTTMTSLTPLLLWHHYGVTTMTSLWCYYYAMPLLWCYYYDITMVLLLWRHYGVTTMTSLTSLLLWHH